MIKFTVLFFGVSTVSNNGFLEQNLNPYPNPLEKGQLLSIELIDILKNEGVADVKLFDSSGKLLMHRKVNQITNNLDILRVDSQELTNGYNIIMIYSDGKYYSKKIFVK